jgi:mRNA interferase HigB
LKPNLSNGSYIKNQANGLWTQTWRCSGALNEWWKKNKEANWASLADIRRTFNSVDFVGNDRYVFNIKGKKYRLVAMIFFDKRTLYIRFVDTHAEYDKIDCKTI